MGKKYSLNIFEHYCIDWHNVSGDKMNKIAVPNTYLYEFDISKDLVDDAFQLLLEQKEKSKSISMGKTEDATLGIFLSDKDGNYKPFYHENLFDEIQKCVDEVCALHFPPKYKLVICDSWITKNTLGKRSGLHHHSWSIFSGLLYFTDHKKSETVFHAEDPFHTQHLSMFDDVLLQENKTTYAPKKGKLIIWRSSLKHNTNSHSEPNTRYALAFNTWFTGVISSNVTGQLEANCVDVSTWSSRSE